MVTREQDDFRETLRKAMVHDLFTDARVMDVHHLGNIVDHDAINKCRLSRYDTECKLLKHMTRRTGDMEDMERMRGHKGDYGYDATYFDLHDNLALLYFNHYGQNYEGGDIVDDPNKYQCPMCHIKFEMGWKQLPEFCPRCHHITPLGELIRDKIYKRY